MSKFIIDNSFWELFPNAKLGVVLLKDFKNSNDSPQEIKKFLLYYELQGGRRWTGYRLANR